jgi:hypothetical protein
MRRFLLGFLVALALAIPATIIGAPPKTVAVTNPMSADLDANGHAITNASQVSADWLIANTKVSVSGAEVMAGGGDPSLGLDADAGSIYLRRHGDSQGVAHGELWLKTGIYPTDWICVAGCAP